jgi:hypothetical protein
MKIKEWFQDTFLFTTDNYTSEGNYRIWYFLGMRFKIKNIPDISEPKEGE